MEDWMEQLHQTGMRLRQRFCTVQNLVIRALVREKANSCLSHPDVIDHTSVTNTGNKCSFSVAKVEDAILIRQKRQHDMGRFEAMKYFDKEVNKKVTWLVIFNDVKARGEREECDQFWQCHDII
jgi:sulfur transfer complex TusBCD TusB component (DsrH family)